MLYVMFRAIVTSGPMAEHNNDRLNKIGLGPIGPIHRLSMTMSDNDLFRERSGSLWNFRFGRKVPELYGTLRILRFRVFTVECWTIYRRCIVLSS